MEFDEYSRGIPWFMGQRSEWSFLHAFRWICNELAYLALSAEMATNGISSYIGCSNEKEQRMTTIKQYFYPNF